MVTEIVTATKHCEQDEFLMYYESFVVYRTSKRCHETSLAGPNGEGRCGRLKNVWKDSNALAAGNVAKALVLMSLFFFHCFRILQD